MKSTPYLRANLILALGLVVLCAGPLAAQGGAPVIVLQGGTVHTLAGPPIENGTVIIRGGRIAAVGANLEIPDDATEVINVAGLDVYPGLFDSLSRLGLTEIGAVSATGDTTELGNYNPELRAATAIHPASEHIPVARANGVTHAVAAPGSGGISFFGFGGFGGGVMPGQASLVHLSGWTVEQMLIQPSVGLVLNWPTIQTLTFDFSTFSIKEKPFTQAKKEYEERVAELEEWIEAAQHYAQALEQGSAENFQRDLKLEALVPVVRGQLPVLLMANLERDIHNGLEFCEKHGLKVILFGGAEAWKVKEMLAEKGIPVVLRPTQAMPGQEDEPYDQPFANPGELHAAGVTFAFATFSSSNSRLLPYQAAMAVPYGLPREEALRAVTLNPAEIFGVADQFGTIKEGKVANLIVTDGDPLEIPTEVRYLIIQGKITSTDNKHKELYERYMARP
ncbi:amidohydrolase family protein [Acidobacteriia bacterium AH_259_A11_L15]|nr:amidohydrolase family protein [Acidobacteriia bacterium AH_259_A11_L15]